MEASSCPWAEAAPVRACACDGARQPTPTAGGSRHLALVPTRHHGMTCSVPTQTPHLLMYIVLCATTCWASSGARFGPPGPGHLPSADDGFSFIHSISRALPFSGEHEGEHEQSRGRRLGSHVHCLAAADMSRARHPEPGDVSSGLSTALAPAHSLPQQPPTACKRLVPRLAPVPRRASRPMAPCRVCMRRASQANARLLAALDDPGATCTVLCQREWSPTAVDSELEPTQRCVCLPPIPHFWLA